MSLTTPSPPTTASMPPSPCPSSPASETANSRLPSTPSTGAVWAELASLTVAAFTEPLVAQLHAFIARNPHFEHAHLQMLGPIVIRHVAIMLDDLNNVEPPCCNDCQCQCDHRRHFRSQSVRVPPSTRPHSSLASVATDSYADQRAPSYATEIPRRPSYRDMAYHAVKLNKILPASLADVPTNTNTGSKIIRRLSITTPHHMRPKQEEPHPEHAISSSPVQSSTSPTSDERFSSEHIARRHVPSTSQVHLRHRPHYTTSRLDHTDQPIPQQLSKHSQPLQLDVINDDITPHHRQPAYTQPKQPTNRPPGVNNQLETNTQPVVRTQPVENTPEQQTRVRPSSMKVVNRPWRHQTGAPNATSRVFPRANVQSTVDMEPTRSFRFRSKRSAIPSPSVPQSSRQEPPLRQRSSRILRQPLNTNPTGTTSRLVLLRRQRERRRSSLR